MSRVVRIDPEVAALLVRERRPRETWNDVVRRLLGMPPGARVGRRRP